MSSQYLSKVLYSTKILISNHEMEIALLTLIAADILSQTSYLITIQARY